MSGQGDNKTKKITLQKIMGSVNRKIVITFVYIIASILYNIEKRSALNKSSVVVIEEEEGT